jgi:hypothetical protein
MKWTWGFPLVENVFSISHPARERRLIVHVKSPSGGRSRRPRTRRLRLDAVPAAGRGGGGWMPCRLRPCDLTGRWPVDAAPAATPAAGRGGGRGSQLVDVWGSCGWTWRRWLGQEVAGTLRLYEAATTTLHGRRHRCGLRGRDKVGWGASGGQPQRGRPYDVDESWPSLADPSYGASRTDRCAQSVAWL